MKDVEPEGRWNELNMWELLAFKTNSFDMHILSKWKECYNIKNDFALL